MCELVLRNFHGEDFLKLKASEITDSLYLCELELARKHPSGVRRVCEIQASSWRTLRVLCRSGEPEVPHSWKSSHLSSYCWRCCDCKYSVRPLPTYAELTERLDLSLVPRLVWKSLGSGITLLDHTGTHR